LLQTENTRWGLGKKLGYGEKGGKGAANWNHKKKQKVLKMAWFCVKKRVKGGEHRVRPQTGGNRGSPGPNCRGKNAEKKGQIKRPAKTQKREKGTSRISGPDKSQRACVPGREKKFVEKQKKTPGRKLVWSLFYKKRNESGSG